MSLRRPLLLLAGTAALAATPAAAKVYQIEADGTVLVRQDGGAVGWERADAKPKRANRALSVPGRRPVPLFALNTRVVPVTVVPARVVPVNVIPGNVIPVNVVTATPAAPRTASGLLDGAAMLHQAAAQAGLHPAVLEALVWQESRWRPGAISRKGAIGLTQLMPDTARELGVDPRDPVANLNGGARYLRSMLDHFDGDLVKALAAYNAGARRVEAWNGVPPIAETQNYVASILGRLGRTTGSR